MTATFGGQIHTGGIVREMGIWSGQTSYDVFAAPTDMEGAILAVSPFVEGNYHPDPVLAAVGVRCRAVRPERNGRGLLGNWTLVLDWSNAPIDEEEQERLENPNPLNRKAVIDVITSREDVARGKNRDGTPQRNSAGAPPNPALKDVRIRFQFRVRKNYAVIPAWFTGLKNKTNEDPVFIGQQVQATFPPNTLLFLPEGSPSQSNENDQTFCEVQFLLEYREEGWDEEVLDVGFYTRAPSDVPGLTSPRKPILDSTGEQVKEPALLDGSGGRSTDGPHFWTSEYKSQSSFSDIASVLA